MQTFQVVDSVTHPQSPSESEIRTALESVLASAEFSRAKRIGDFLRFIVEETLSGRGERLKAFTIAREVYDRDESFDPRRDTIVRVDAGRLRSRLESYYEAEGRNDPLRIEIPVGGYTPVFTPNPGETAKAEPEAALEPVVEKPGWNVSRHAGVALAILLAVILGLFFVTDGKRNDSVSPDAGSSLEKRPADFLVILPLQTLAGTPLENRLAAGLQEAVITDLAKLSGISVMAHASLMNLGSSPADLTRLKGDFGATHALRGSLEQEGEQIRVNLQLVDIRSGTTVWAERLDSNAENLLDLQDAISQQIIKHLTIQTSPAERALLQRRHTSSPEAFALYRQALVLLIPPRELERIITSRHMFRRVIDLDPEFAGGYAGLGFTHAITVLFSHTDKPAIEIEKSIDMALQAIDKDSEFGMGHATLALAYALSGRQQEAFSSARRAVEVQPGDAFTQFVQGLTLLLADRPGEAIPPLSESIRLDPAEPRTPYRNVLGLAYFARREYATAAELFDTNLRQGGPRTSELDIIRAAAYAQTGRESEAKAMIGALVEFHPKAPFRQWMAKWVKDPDDLERLMTNLQRLGLPET